MSISGGVDRAIERGCSVGCQTVQIFLKNNMQWKGKELLPDEIDRFREKVKSTGIEPVFAHSSYLINLGAVNLDFLRLSIEALIDEIQRADQLGVPFIVLHPGAHMGAGEKAGIERIAKSLNKIFQATAKSNVKIALETTAGQGSALGYRFEQLEEIIESVELKKRLVVCVDTCHVFAAGYDIRSSEGYRAMVKEIKKRIGTKQVIAFHLNDSKKPLGSRVDRHDHIGKGQIGLEGFRNILLDPLWKDLPMVLETPKSKDLHEDIENMNVLRGLVVSRK